MGVGAVAATAFTVSTGGLGALALGALALGAAAGTVGVAGAVTTHCIASEYTKSEHHFKHMGFRLSTYLQVGCIITYMNVFHACTMGYICNRHIVYCQTFMGMSTR